MAIRALHITKLGRDGPIQLVERQGDLVLEMFNYRGQEKRFWELRWPGAFYQGRPIISFYLEVAPRSAYPAARHFAQAVASGLAVERIDQPFTYPAEGERVYAVSYERDGRSLSLDIDLMQFRMRSAKIGQNSQQEPVGWPMLDSAIVRQSADGNVSIKDATLTCTDGPTWLLAIPERNLYVAGYTGVEPATIKLETPVGSYQASDFGMGTVVMQNGKTSLHNSQ
jgi:hypothetical protein